MSALEQGDIIEVDFTPAFGHEPAKRRPAVVASVFSFNQRSSLVMLVPLTRTDSGYPLHVPVNGFGAMGFACVEQMRSVDIVQRGYSVLGYADDATMKTILQAIRAVFDLR